MPVTAGLSALDEGSELIPQRTLDEIARCSVALKGPCTTPVGEGFTSINVKLRKTFNLYAAVRPVRSMPGVETRYKDVDLIIIRENTEGLYSGVEKRGHSRRRNEYEGCIQGGMSTHRDLGFSFRQSAGA